MRYARSKSCGSFKFRTMPRLQRFALMYRTLVPRWRGRTVRARSPCGGSILITSAPNSARKRPVTGPTPSPEISITRTPASGPPRRCTNAGAAGGGDEEAVGGQPHRLGTLLGPSHHPSIEELLALRCSVTQLCEDGP